MDGLDLSSAQTFEQAFGTGLYWSIDRPSKDIHLYTCTGWAADDSGNGWHDGGSDCRLPQFRSQTRVCLHQRGRNHQTPVDHRAVVQEGLQNKEFKLQSVGALLSWVNSGTKEHAMDRR